MVFTVEYYIKKKNPQLKLFKNVAANVSKKLDECLLLIINSK